MPTNALQVLKQSHQQISGLFELVQNSPDLSEKLTLFQQIKEELDLYSLVEQKIFYPALSQFDEVSDLIDQSYDEHDEIADLVEEIDQMEVEAIEGDHFDTTMDEFDDAITELRDMYGRHIEREERELYPEIAQLLSDDDLLAIGNEMNEIRSLGMAA